MMNLRLGEALLTLQNSKLTDVPPYAEQTVQNCKEELRRLHDEVKTLNEQRKKEDATEDPKISAFRKARVALMVDQIYRIKRFLLLYHSFRCDRLQDQLWHFGGSLKESEKENLSEKEKPYFSDYKQLVMGYVQQVGVDLLLDLDPPLQSEVEVRILRDCGEVLTDNNQVIKLQKNASLFINRRLIEPYVKQGYAVIKK